MNRIAHRILKANFNTLESNLTINHDELLDIIKTKDNRFVPKAAITYNDMSMFGGIYIEDPSADGKEHLFSVEIVAYKNINTAKGITNAVAAVATPIRLKEYTQDEEQLNNINNYELGPEHYVTIMQEDNYIEIIHEMKSQLPVQNTELKYKAASLSEYLSTK